MRIAELSRASGVPVPTIKYYLREGLLPAGASTGPNQAEYGEPHLRRLRLIRALIEVGGVSIAATREVVAVLDQRDLPTHSLLGSAHRAVAPARTPDRSSDAWRTARADAVAIAAGRGWEISPDAPGLDHLADVLTVLRGLDLGPWLEGVLDRYADTAQRLADLEVASVAERGEPEQMMERVVIGTVLGGELFAALRLLAHEAASANQFGSAQAGSAQAGSAQAGSAQAGSAQVGDAGGDR